MPKTASQSQQPDARMGYRRLSVRAQTLNEPARSVDVVLASETPVEVWGVPETLRMDGIRWRSGNQLPLLDSHNRGQLADIIGSLRNCRVEGTELVATAVFTEGAEGERALRLLREGHLTDLSVGFEIHQVTRINEGQTMDVNGRVHVGPCDVVTEWTPFEGSFVAVGADPTTTARNLPAQMRAYLFPELCKKGKRAMDETYKAWLVQMGMPEDMDDTQANAWAMANLNKKEAAPAAETPDETKTKAEDDPPPEGEDTVTLGKKGGKGRTATPVVDVAKIAREAAEKAIAEREARDTRHRSEVDSLCELADCPELAASLYGVGDITKVRAKISEHKAKTRTSLAPGYSFSAGPAQRDKHVGLVRSALFHRIADDHALNEDRRKRYLQGEVNNGWEQYRYASALDLATACMQADGLRTHGLSRPELAMMAMGRQDLRRRSGDPAYHTTGSFGVLVQDAINKTLLAGYQERPQSWRLVFRQAASVPDFKSIHRIRLGGLSNIPGWADNSVPQQLSASNEQEVYAVEARAAEVSYSWQLLVNDDLDALSRTPFMLGQAAERTINAVAWKPITDNATLSDSVALFAAATGARKRTNLTTGAGAPSVTTLQTLTNLMQQMRGLNTPEGNEGSDILNLLPRFIVGPSALSTTIKQLVLSAYDPSTSVNHMVYNTATELIPVIEPLLDLNSTVAWYLFADPGQVDTVEVSFLQGQESPQTSMYEDPKTHSLTYQVIQTYAAKAIDHRGVQKHAGQ